MSKLNISVIFDKKKTILAELNGKRKTTVAVEKATALELYLHGHLNNVPEASTALMDDRFINYWNVVYRSKLLNELKITTIVVEHTKVLDWVEANINNSILKLLMETTVPTYNETSGECEGSNNRITVNGSGNSINFN